MKLLLCRGKSLQRIPRIGQGECPRIPGELVINGRVAIRIHKEDSFLIREILLDYDIADVKAVHLLSEALQAEASTPFVLLTEHADEKTVAEIIAAGAWDCMEKSELNGANLVRTIGCALALHSMQQDRQSSPTGWTGGLRRRKNQRKHSMYLGARERQSSSPLFARSIPEPRAIRKLPCG